MILCANVICHNSISLEKIVNYDLEFILPVYKYLHTYYHPFIISNVRNYIKNFAFRNISKEAYYSKIIDGLHMYTKGNVDIRMKEQIDALTKLINIKKSETDKKEEIKKDITAT